MRVFASIFAVALMFAVLLDAFEAMILPRRATRKYRPARLYYRVFWFVWTHVAHVIRRRGIRQHFLSVFGPLSLLGLFAVWVTLLIFSFALFEWSLASPMGHDPSAPTLATCVYLSGQTFFTLGFGDFAPTASVGRFLSVLEAGMGFGFMAVIIGYLPVLYQAFSRRERTIGLLDARASSPPTAGELLGRVAKARALTQMDPLLGEWESWSADLLESQLSFPVLAFYRSQHDNQSWVACLAAILDTCALLLANILDINRHQVQITFAMSRHAAVDLALIFKTPPSEPPEERLPNQCYECLLQSFAASGLRIDNTPAAAARLQELRAMYEPYLAALSKYFEFELPPLASPEVAIDNWQKSPWQPRAPGIGSLPVADPGEHFAG